MKRVFAFVFIISFITNYNTVSAQLGDLSNLSFSGSSWYVYYVPVINGSSDYTGSIYLKTRRKD